MYFVYIIQSSLTKEYYKGLTDNIDRRIKQHFKGQTLFAKHRLPLRLIHVEICADRITARKLEKFFKSGYGREIIAEIANEL